MDRQNEQAQRYQISEASKKVGLSQKRIRDYEKAGLLKPWRAPRTNNRLYDESDINRLIRIKELIHEYGFTLTCLRHYIVAAPCWTIFQCNNKISCPAYRNPHSHCYEARHPGNTPISGKCKRCPVYMNRNSDRITLLKHT